MIDFAHHPVGDTRTACPACNRGRKDTALSITVNPDGSGIAHCFRCGLVERSGKPATYRPRPPAPPKQQRGFTPWMRDLWRQCQPISGTAAGYLRARHCVIPPADGHLRWHPQLKHRSGHVGPAMVALVTHADTREPLGLHRTWITATGKADVEPNKMMLGQPLDGGVIRLWPDDAVTRGLGVAEGVETALSLAHAFQPVWCLMDAGHLAKFQPLRGVETLVIARDNDPAGIAAAYDCSAAWTAAGAEVFVTDQAENDVNDVVREVAA